MKFIRYSMITLLLCAVAVLAAACTASPVKIAVLTEPNTLVVPLGGVPDLTGGEVLVTYDDGSTKTVSMTELEVRNLNVNAEETQTAVLVYTEGDKAYSTTIDLRVEEPRPVSLTVDDARVKKDYFEGESFSVDGLVVTAHYSDGTDKAISAYAVYPTKLEADTTSVHVSYRGVGADVAVNVTAKALDSIALKTPLTVTEYYTRAPFSSEGVSVTATFNNRETLTVQSTDLAFLREDGSVYLYPRSVEDAQVFVTYTFREVTRSIPVTLTVHDPAVSGMTLLESEADSLVLYEGDRFDLDAVDVSVCIAFQNETSEEVRLHAARFDCEDKVLALGDDAVDVWVKGYPEVKLSVPVTVLANVVEDLTIVSPPTKAEYDEGETVDLAGLVLRATYSNGASVEVTYGAESGITAEPTVLAFGTTSVTIIYDGGETTSGVSVRLVNLPLDSFTLTDECEVRRAYGVGDLPDLTGATFDAVFGGGDAIVLSIEDAESEVEVVSGTSDESGSVIAADSVGLRVTVSFLFEGRPYEGVAFIPITVE